MQNKDARFDVAIISVIDGKIEAIIGHRLDQVKADKRLLTGLSRINGNYFVDILPAGKYKAGQAREGK